MENGDNDEEAIRNKEQEILELGERYKKEKKAQELAQLIRDVRPFLAMISKAKAAKLVRGLVDLFLDMEASTGTEVQLCKVSKAPSWWKVDGFLQLWFNLGVHQLGCGREANIPAPEFGSKIDCPVL